jgi:hypothetical protein
MAQAAIVSASLPRTVASSHLGFVPLLSQGLSLYARAFGLAPDMRVLTLGIGDLNSLR